MYVGCLSPGFWIPLLDRPATPRRRSCGWACKRRLLCWLPAGTPSVRQKLRQFTNTAEVCATASGHTLRLYHADRPKARVGLAPPRPPWTARAGTLQCRRVRPDGPAARVAEEGEAWQTLPSLSGRC